MAVWWTGMYGKAWDTSIPLQLCKTPHRQSLRKLKRRESGERRNGTYRSPQLSNKQLGTVKMKDVNDIIHNIVLENESHILFYPLPPCTPLPDGFHSSFLWHSTMRLSSPPPRHQTAWRYLCQPISRLACPCRASFPFSFL